MTMRRNIHRMARLGQLRRGTIPIRPKEYNISESCHCAGVKPEAISHCLDCFVASLLAMRTHIMSVTKIIANRYQGERELISIGDAQLDGYTRLSP